MSDAESLRAMADKAGPKKPPRVEVNIIQQGAAK